MTIQNNEMRNKQSALGVGIHENNSNQGERQECVNRKALPRQGCRIQAEHTQARTRTLPARSKQHSDGCFHSLSFNPDDGATTNFHQTT